MILFGEKINKVYILDFLKDDERAKDHVSATLSEYFDSHAVPNKITTVNSREELLSQLTEIGDDEINDEGVLIHFSCHGDPFSPSFGRDPNNAIHWSDALPLLKKINILTKNKLILNTMGVCYSHKLSELPDLQGTYLKAITATFNTSPSSVMRDCMEVLYTRSMNSDAADEALRDINKQLSAYNKIEHREYIIL